MPTIRAIAILILVIWLFIDGAVVFRHRTGSAESRDRFSLQAILIGNLIAWSIGIGLAYSSLGTLHSVALQLAGLAILLAGIALRFVAIAQLGRFHTPNVAVLGDHRLIETGLYRRVRHPSYLGALVAFLGFSMALGNWLSIVSIMFISVCVYVFRIHEEEAALRAAFGAAYSEYCRRTHRLLPGLY